VEENFHEQATYRITGFGFGCLMLVGLGFAPWATTGAQEKGDTQIAVLAGEWKITYTHDALRVYVIDTGGGSSRG
jgi:hypothetical protein